MKIKAQISMVLNLDKCIGCHTCSIPCKNVWTNRKGAEYMWFNNVETKPGLGYPREWENQKLYRGGWTMQGGKLHLSVIVVPDSGTEELKGLRGTMTIEVVAGKHWYGLEYAVE